MRLRTRSPSEIQSRSHDRYVKTLPGARELLVSYHKGKRAPEGFYLKLGFEPTGEVIEGEFVARLPLK